MRRPAPLVFGTLAAMALISGRARASDSNDKEQCISAAERGQQLRDDGKLQLAHDAFAQCARSACPSMVKTDCAAWLREVDEKTPTVVLKASDETGGELTNVIVLMDDASIAATLDGKPVAVDPGEHVFHFETTGLPAVEQRVVIRAADRGRLIRVRFTAAQSPASSVTAPPVAEGAAPAGGTAPAAPEATAPEAPVPPTSPATSPPLASWIFGGVALAAFGSEAFFGLGALADRSADLAPGGCSPHCGSSEKSSIQTRFVVADVSLGVGLLSAGLATYFFLASRGPSRSLAFDFAPRPGGGVTTLGGRF